MSTDLARNILIDISPGNTSMLHLRLFLSKYRSVCNIKVLLPVLVEDAGVTIDNLGFRFQYGKIRSERYDKRNPLDFIFIPFRVKALNLKTIHSIETLFTQAAIILFEYTVKNYTFLILQKPL